MVNRPWAFALALVWRGRQFHRCWLLSRRWTRSRRRRTCGRCSGRGHPWCGSGVNKAVLPKAATPPRSRTARNQATGGDLQKPVVKSH